MNGFPATITTKSGRITALDGVRGFFAIIVVASHYGFIECGWVGVQIFFVMSGFLITSILLRSREQGAAPYFGLYFWRRALRILPLYLVFLGLCALLYAKSPETVPGRIWGSVLTFTYNLTITGNTNTAYLFSHTWSLDVEEQFYIVWPFVVFLLGPRALRAVVIGILVAIPLLRIALNLAAGGMADGMHVPYALYFHTVFAIDSLATGAALAVFGWVGMRLPRWVFPGALALVGLAGGINWLTFGSPPPVTLRGVIEQGPSLGYPLFMTGGAQYLWGYTAVNLIGGLLVITVAQPGSLSRFFEWRFLRYMGRISYGIYIFHVPVLVLARLGFHIDSSTTAGMLAFIPLMGLITGIAHLSYFHYEKRFLDLRPPRFLRRDSSKSAGVLARDDLPVEG